ncbi:MFS transporter [Pseudonocardia sp. Ae505_Ps2]|uniref:MFS transporter n=1 Tax=Pseudonocardia sp. Ae505_Ps2 TaxID=1885034 RepID=UPI00094E0FCF|nr:MFS transporter [Pseudonocardia sp. Ae505_Ps2]OLM12832.1 L-Proline/Glycine betaine transporter ProP [Pseudonocardia sp. Ae505_Ps2]
MTLSSDAPTGRAAETPSTPSPSSARSRRAALAAASGTAVEYYEFGVYGYLAVVIGPLFFPSADPVASLLSTLAVFGSAFLMRPLGGIVLGRLGDRLGRKPVLVFTITGMGTATALVGLLPTAATAGLLAPALLVLARLAQGFLAGGEVTGSATYLAESSPAGRRGFFGSFTPVGVALGGGTAALVAGVTSTLLTAEQLSAFGWRIPFLLALPLVVLTLIARHRLEDSEEFEHSRAAGELPKAPVQEVLTHHRRALVTVLLLATGSNAGYWIGLIFMNIYLTSELGYPKSSTFWLMAAIGLFVACLMPLAGALSDRYGRKKLIVAGFLGYSVLILPTMALMGTGDFTLAVLGMFLLALPMPVVQAVTYPTYAEQFPTRVRYTGLSLAFNGGTIIGGGLTPFLATWLTSVTGDPLAPGYLLMVATVVALLTLLTVRETARRELAR